MMRIIVALLISAILCQNLSAQYYCGNNYRSYGTYGPVYTTPIYSPPVTYVRNEIVTEYVTKTIVAPIAIPLLVPNTVFQYLPAVAPPVVSTPVVPQVPVAQTVAPQLPSPALQAADIERMINEKVATILRGQQYVNDSGPPVLQLPEQLAADTKPQETPAPTGNLTQQVATLLGSQSCVNCHTAGDKPVKGNVTLFVKKDGKLFFQPSVPKDKIVASLLPDPAGKVAMPPDGKVQSQQDLVLLRKWQGER